jgi:hypothetical protein
MRAATTLICAAALLATAAGANPRDPATRSTYAAPVPVVQPDAMGAWLRRLAGKYRVEGLVEVVYNSPDYDPHRCGVPAPDPPESVVEPFCQQIKGAIDCVNIGSGPGIQCILQVTWNDFYEIIRPVDLGKMAGAFTLPGGTSYLAPAMLLLGIEPGRGGVNYLLVDNKGLPEGGPGSIAGDRATFRTSCVNGPTLLNSMKPQLVANRPLQTCDRVLRIDAREGSSVVHLAFDIEVNEEMFTRFELWGGGGPPPPG